LKENKEKTYRKHLLFYSKAHMKNLRVQNKNRRPMNIAAVDVIFKGKSAVQLGTFTFSVLE